MLTKSRGLGLIELIVASGIFAVIASTGIVIMLNSYTINRLADDETEAALYAQEGIEAVLSIRNQAWSNLSAGSYGLSSSSGYWRFSGSEDSYKDMVRVATVSAVYRDSSHNVATSGGYLDRDTFKVSSQVAWNSVPVGKKTTTLTTFVTNFRKLWNAAVQIAAVDLSGTQGGYKIKIAGNYAYVLRSAGAVDLFIIEMTDPYNPTVMGSLTLDESGNELTVAGDYVYIASTSDSQELQVVDVTNKAAPVLAGSANLTGNLDALGIYQAGSYVYITRQASAPQQEFYVVNVTTPTAPSVTASLELVDNANEVVVLGNYAYVASASNTQELQVVDITTPATPTLAGSLALAGNDNAVTIDGFDNLVVIGRLGGLMHTIDVSVPTAPVEYASFSAGDNINDVAVGHSGTLAFLATDNVSLEFQVTNIQSPSSISLYYSYNAADMLNGVGYDTQRDLAAAVGEDNATEWVIWGPR